MKHETTHYVIRFIRHYPLRPLYERIRPTTMGFTTPAIEEAKTWKTREAAERWLVERCLGRGEVIALAKKIKRC